MSFIKCGIHEKFETGCPQCEDGKRRSELAPASGSTPKGPDHLAIAQKCFEKWLRELDGKLHDSELGFDEYAGAIQNGDVETMKTAMYRATQSLRMARLMIKAGLEAGV